MLILVWLQQWWGSLFTWVSDIFAPLFVVLLIGCNITLVNAMIIVCYKWVLDLKYCDGRNEMNNFSCSKLYECHFNLYFCNKVYVCVVRIQNTAPLFMAVVLAYISLVNTTYRSASNITKCIHSYTYTHMHIVYTSSAQVVFIFAYLTGYFYTVTQMVYFFSFEKNWVRAIIIVMVALANTSN